MMIRFRQPSAQTATVLNVLAASPGNWRYGYDLCRETGLKAGSMYPILIRLADRGLLETTWEREPVEGRPPRHLYRITGAGAEYFSVLTQVDTNINVPALTPQAGEV